MSNIYIRRALEVQLDSIVPEIETAWENTCFIPVNDVPYQLVHLLFATPINPSIGGVGSTILTRQSGFLQVSLMYPLQSGTLVIDSRVDLIKASFKRGTTLVNSGQTIVIKNTPDVTNIGRDNDRWRIAVKIPFYSNVFL